MNSIDTIAGTAVPRRGRRRRQVWTFARHYLEMIAAMVLGMVTLYPLWLLGGGGGRGTEVEVLVMATTMVVPMAAWMAYRRHRALVLEMAVAMYAGFVVLFPPLWAGVLDDLDVMMVGHGLMLVFMLVAMLARFSEYAGHENGTRG